MCARVFVRVRVYMCVRESVPVYVLARFLYIVCLFVCLFLLTCFAVREGFNSDD